MFPKRKPMRNKRYLEYVRKLSCLMCGSVYGSDPHHIKGIGHFSGVGQKASDYLTMPLCRNCHEQMHRDPTLWPLQLVFVLQTMVDALKAEKLKLETDVLIEIVRNLENEIGKHDHHKRIG